MTPWENINAELERRRLGWQWLADRLEMSIQRVGNWKDRGIPPPPQFQPMQRQTVCNSFRTGTGVQTVCQ